MTQLPLVIDTSSALTASFAEAGAKVVRTSGEIVDCFRDGSETTRWIASPNRMKALTQALTKVPVPPIGAGQALLGFERTKPESAERRAFLASYFSRLVLLPKQSHYLPAHEMVDVMTSERPGDYVIGGVVDHLDKVMVLYRGTLAPLPVPFKALRPSSAATPDFRQFKVTDYGQTLELGDYAASVEGILYERDAEVRRYVKANRLALDPSFGGAFHRLRLLKGLTQDAFAPGLSERAVRRIESGETPASGVQAAHRRVIENTLGVPFDEIGTY